MDFTFFFILMCVENFLELLIISNVISFFSVVFATPNKGATSSEAVVMLSLGCSRVVLFH